MTLRLALVGVAAALAITAPAPAAAAEPCWQLVLSDWSDGRIDRVYSPECYRGALAHLPADAERVSTVSADLQRGLADSLAAGPQAAPRSESSSTPALIVIAAGGAFLLLSTGRMLLARRARGR